MIPILYDYLYSMPQKAVSMPFSAGNTVNLQCADSTGIHQPYDDDDDDDAIDARSAKMHIKKSER